MQVCKYVSISILNVVFYENNTSENSVNFHTASDRTFETPTLSINNFQYLNLKKLCLNKCYKWYCLWVGRYVHFYIHYLH